jgi:hypothetical protein
LRITLRVVSRVFCSEGYVQLPLVVNASAYNPPNSHREDCVCFRRVPEAIHEVVLALHAVSLRLAFLEDFQVAVVFAIIVYGDPFLARRAIMVF